MHQQMLATMVVTGDTEGMDIVAMEDIEAMEAMADMVDTEDSMERGPLMLKL